ncbi:porin family protein [Aquimarina pacifica]|uniref:porin family protein n=1 Tax=Aquimarina pacifica TaxID=1296415 RepID=UPI00046FFA1A|nr:porin family protein [Aquimarina pacifica]
MKNIFVGFMLFAFFAISAQERKIVLGIKAGLNYGDNGSIEITDAARLLGNDRFGYHLGVFIRGQLTDHLYLKPELQYTINNSNYDVDNATIDYTIRKLDLPILLGISVLGPIHLFGGPALQYIVENDLQDVQLKEVKNQFTIGVQFGTGIQLERINIDIRYERGLSKNQAEALNQDIRIDTRPNQLILGIGIDL